MIAKCDGDWIEDPTWEEALKLLESARADGNVYFLENNAILGFRQARELVIEFDYDFPLYWPYMIVNEGDCAYDFFYYDNIGAQGKWVNFVGRGVQDRWLTDDYELIKNIAKEFLAKGWVKFLIHQYNMKGKAPNGRGPFRIKLDVPV